ncbi:hypothetical protein TheveDRAFT_0527 [Thermanaerovibrio velox DSM 12556]|uniref:Organic solvent tolerance-like N-terminal domain-containing protein n=1 Tax=Thermanaerovibrio velox DSM 12556 TaxID=926567 RepID=H0UQD4_9BACT|nr:hypothetical protein [Thermanaerovibrio velox]EHM09688.1 hypothetical protein TheveDRAFT_0527 [Thermanaerovibrio velox DSM 12556]
MRRFLAFAAGLALLSVAASSSAQDGVTRLTAQRLIYDGSTERFRAEGGVRVQQDQLEASGDVGEGRVSGEAFSLKGNVVALFKRERVKVLSQTLDVSSKGRGIYEAVARGGVRAVRGDEILTCSTARWTSDGLRYTLEGSVKGTFMGKMVDADRVERNLFEFSGFNVRRYRDMKEGFELRAPSVRGRLDRSGAVESAEAAGGVTCIAKDKNGADMVMTGDRASYDGVSGAVEVIGSAKVVQPGGRTLTADRIVYQTRVRRLEAYGSTQVTFPAKGSRDGEEVKR